MPDLIDIRPAQPTECPMLHAMIVELAHYERLAAEVQARPEDLCRHLFAQPPRAQALIALAEAEPVGFAIFFHNYSTFTGRPGLYLEDLYVRPTHRRQGIGQRLLTRLAEIAIERDCARMEWSVLTWNTPAIEFYRRLGACALEDWRTFRLTERDIHTLGGRRG